MINYIFIYRNHLSIYLAVHMLYVLWLAGTSPCQFCLVHQGQLSAARSGWNSTNPCHPGYASLNASQRDKMALLARLPSLVSTAMRS